MAARNFQYPPKNRGGSRCSSRNVSHLSKALSWLLRHGMVKEGLQLHDDGYIFVDDVLQHPSFIHKYTIDDIHQCVETDDKKRFGLKIDEETGKEMIRAHQGHSIEEVKIDMREIKDPNEFPNVIHGTYVKYWSSIKDKGLSKMNRTHIHFAPGLPKEAGVISGMRRSADLYIYADLEKAIKDGFQFFLSSNNVILCAGNQGGFLPTCYFRFVETRTGERLNLSTDS